MQNRFGYYEEKYKNRELEESAIVTRFAPSPTGFIHIGGIYQSLIAKKLAVQTNGVFFLRIEDTDQKREVENGVLNIINALKDYNLNFDEGMSSENTEKGSYGPYKQSDRKDIYQAYAKFLLSQGKAYPCFATVEELENMRQKQENAKVRPGYYGIWAKYRSLPIDEAIEKINNGEDYIIRFKSNGREDRKIKYKDAIRGTIEFPENDQDIIIIKSDGLPTYHFAHVVDDYLMKTTLVIRGDEWLSSVPVHLQLFYELGFKPPKYAHIAPIMKNDNGNKRKLSKRKDQEAAVDYYSEIGVPAQAVKEYLMNIANSNFEEWRRQNPNLLIHDFDFKLNKMNVSGALFDFVKLLDISKIIISKYNGNQIYEETLNWSKKYDMDLAKLLEKDKEYAIKVFNIERGNVKPRKDIAKWSDVKESIEYMYDIEFYNSKREYGFQKINDIKDVKQILKEYINNFYNENDTKEIWFDKIKGLAENLGYAKEVKEYKNNPEKYKGHVGDISTVLRISLTNKSNTPDMYEIMQILGKDRIIKRFDEICNIK